MKVTVSQKVLFTIIAVLMTIFLLRVDIDNKINKSGGEQFSQVQDLTDRDVVTISIQASRWEFTPSTVKVKKGQRVRIRIKVTDVTHGIAIPEYGINEILAPNQEKVVEFVADRSGSFTFYCSVACGPGHSNMRGTIEVSD